MTEEYSKKKITAVGVVYNEIYRIESTLKCFLWCDEIVVVDKNSNDGTRDIINKYTKNLVTINKLDFDPQLENSAWYNNVNTEWVIGFTSSDIIHPKLAIEIKKLIENDDYTFDIIEIPFSRYVLGIDSKYSPWYENKSKITVFRKSIYSINTNSVHSANVLNSKRVYTLKVSDPNYKFSHLTHPNMEHMMDRHLNYIRSESKAFNKKSLWLPLKDVFKAFYHVIFRRKTIFYGFDGLALAFSYLSYYMLLFVYKWEKSKKKSNIGYDKIRQEIINEWEKHNV